MRLVRSRPYGMVWGQDNGNETERLNLKIFIKYV